MVIKKANAYLSLITTVLLLIHTGYTGISYIVMYYNPVMSKVTGYTLIGAITAHAVISLIILFVMHDSVSVAYPGLNIRTVIQRICAALMILLLPVHIKSFDLLQRSVGGIGYVLTEICQVLFFTAVFGHIAVSFSKSLITLGILKDNRLRKRIDLILAIICLILCIAIITITLVTHIKLFLG
jgi:hypothetical protein